jgi:phosphoribosylformylglycinamidine synthase
VCLAESVIHSDGLGLEVDLPPCDGRLDAALFGEAQSRVVLSVPSHKTSALSALLDAQPSVQSHRLGTVTDGRVALHANDTPLLRTRRAPLASPYETALARAMEA